MVKVLRVRRREEDMYDVVYKPTAHTYVHRIAFFHSSVQGMWNTYVCMHLLLAFAGSLVQLRKLLILLILLAKQTPLWLNTVKCCATVLYANSTTKASVNYAKQLSTMKPPALLLVLSTLVCLLSLACLRLRPMHCLQWEENYKRKEDLGSKWVCVGFSCQRIYVRMWTMHTVPL